MTLYLSRMNTDLQYRWLLYGRIVIGLTLRISTEKNTVRPAVTHNALTVYASYFM